MLSVLPKATLTHEGLLLGEAHLVPHSPRRPLEDFGYGPNKADSELTSGPGQLPEVYGGPRGQLPEACPVAPEVGSGSLAYGPEGQRQGV